MYILPRSRLWPRAPAALLVWFIQLPLAAQSLHQAPLQRGGVLHRLLLRARQSSAEAGSRRQVVVTGDTAEAEAYAPAAEKAPLPAGIKAYAPAAVAVPQAASAHTLTALLGQAAGHHAELQVAKNSLEQHFTKAQSSAKGATSSVLLLVVFICVFFMIFAAIIGMHKDSKKGLAAQRPAEQMLSSGGYSPAPRAVPDPRLPPSRQSLGSPPPVEKLASPPLQSEPFLGTQSSMATVSSTNPSALGSLTRLVYGSAGRDSMCALVLPTPLLASQDGEAFEILGPISNTYQGPVRVDVTRFVSREVVARLHINESFKGQGILLEFVQRGRVSRYAYFDTSEATLEAGLEAENRQVAILNALEDSWNAAAPPSTIVKGDSSSSSFVLNHCGEDLVKVMCVGSDRPTRIQSCKDGLLLAEVQCSESHPIGRLQCRSNADVGLIVCALAASLKLL